MKISFLSIIFTIIISNTVFSQNSLEKFLTENRDNSPGEPLYVSIIQLISNPENFDGKVISVTGYLKLKFEGTALYFHKEDYLNRIYKNSIWLNISKDDLYKLKKECSDKYVSIIGTFKAKQNGHFGIFSGTISEIRVIDPREND